MTEIGMRNAEGYDEPLNAAPSRNRLIITLRIPRPAFDSKLSHS